MKKIGVILLWTMLFNICMSESIFADESVRVVDGVGHEMVFDETGTLVTSGDTIFDFNGIGEEIYVVKNQDIKDFEVLKDKKYLVKEGSDIDLSFYRVDHKSRTYTEMPLLPGVCKIRRTANKDMSVKAELVCEGNEEVDGVQIIKGSNTKLKVEGVPGAITFVNITDEKGATKYRLDRQMREFVLGDGRYNIKVWNEDSKGNIYEDTLPFDTFIVDNAKPEKPEIELKNSRGKLIKDGKSLIADGDVKIIASSKDEISGIKKYVYEFDDGTQKEGNELVVRSGFKGSFAVWAEDYAGNRSDKAVFGKEIIVDEVSPKLTVKETILTGDILRLSAITDDEISGIKEIKVTIDGVEVCRSEKAETDCSIDVSMLEKGVHSIILTAIDRAGNTSEKRLEMEIKQIESPIDELLKPVEHKAEKVVEKERRLPTIPELLNLNKKYIKTLLVNAPKKALYKDYNNGDIEMFINGENFYGGTVEKPGHYVLSIRTVDGRGRKNVSKAEFIIRHSAN